MIVSTGRGDENAGEQKVKNSALKTESTALTVSLVLTLLHVPGEI